MAKQIEVFIAFDKEDGALLKELEKHLKSLEMEGLITVWNASKIIGGMDWQQEIEKHLELASIVLLLVSANFMASDEAFGLAKQALERSKRQDVRVIPVLLQEVDWTYSIFGGLAPLPANGKPVASWKDRNAAFLDVVKGIRQIVTSLPVSAGNDTISSTALADSDTYKGLLTPAPKSSATLTPFRRHVLEEKLKELHRTWERRNNKKQYIQQALDIESDPTHIFRYEQQIKQENEELARLESEIEQIEQQLQ
jgi:TIR domain